MAKLVSVALGLLLTLSAEGLFAQAPDYTVTIQSGVSPRQSPSNVAAQVLSLVTSGRRSSDAGTVKVTHVECTDGTEFRSSSTQGDGKKRPIWIVRLDVNGPLGTLQYVHTASYVIDDETGEILGYGGSGRGPYGIDLKKLVPAN